MTDYKREVEKGRNAYLEFVKAHPKTVAVVLAALAFAAIFATFS